MQRRFALDRRCLHGEGGPYKAGSVPGGARLPLGGRVVIRLCGGPKRPDRSPHWLGTHLTRPPNPAVCSPKNFETPSAVREAVIPQIFSRHLLLVKRTQPASHPRCM